MCFHAVLAKLIANIFCSAFRNINSYSHSEKAYYTFYVKRECVKLTLQFYY